MRSCCIGVFTFFDFSHEGADPRTSRIMGKGSKQAAGFGPVLDQNGFLGFEHAALEVLAVEMGETGKTLSALLIAFVRLDRGIDGGKLGMG